MLLEDIWRAQDQFRRRQDAYNLHSLIQLTLKRIGSNELMRLNNQATHSRTVLSQLRSKLENLGTVSPVDARVKLEALVMIDAFLRSRVAGKPS